MTDDRLTKSGTNHLEKSKMVLVMCDNRPTLHTENSNLLQTLSLSRMTFSDVVCPPPEVSSNKTLNPHLKQKKEPKTRRKRTLQKHVDI